MFLKDKPFSKMAPPIAKSWIRHWVHAKYSEAWRPWLY